MSRKTTENWENGELPNETWETAEIGEFQTVALADEGDTFIGNIISDVEKKRPEWLPEAFDDNCFETLSDDGKKGIIPKYWKLVQYVNTVGGGPGVLYKIVRGKKHEKGKNKSFVDFDIKHRIIDAKRVKAI